ncbi:MAG: serine/threonine protein kinase, partial [Planctomycetaceae bacterium]|nr:serine/threonine protein kinase [Planctomycetaceae bacterium]
MKQPAPETSDADAAIAEYMERTDAGEVVDRTAFAAARPQCAEELTDFFESEDHFIRMAGPLYSETGLAAAPTIDTHASAAGDYVPDMLAKRPSVPRLPEKFGRYRIQKCLGAGAMGAVWLARDTKLHRSVAIKTPAFDDGIGSELVERFYREARSAANLRHAGICPVFDVGEIDGVHYISMAFIDGRPLSDLVDSQQPLPIDKAVTIVRQIAEALNHAHSEGVIHRDLKPANIMLDEHDRPLVMDFGLARRVDAEDQSRITQDGMIVGTPAYMSPEQV